MRSIIIKIVIVPGSEWQKQCIEEMMHALLIVTKSNFETKHKGNRFEYSLSDEYKTGDLKGKITQKLL